VAGLCICAGCPASRALIWLLLMTMLLFFVQPSRALELVEVPDHEGCCEGKTLWQPNNVNCPHHASPLRPNASEGRGLSQVGLVSSVSLWTLERTRTFYGNILTPCHDQATLFSEARSNDMPLMPVHSAQTPLPCTRVCAHRFP
jgi:hypothetical protein